MESGRGRLTVRVGWVDGDGGNGGPKVFEGAFEDLESRSEVLCVRLSMLLDSLELKYASTLFSLLCEKNCGGWGCGRVAARAGGLGDCGAPSRTWSGTASSCSAS